MRIDLCILHILAKALLILRLKEQYRVMLITH